MDSTPLHVRSAAVDNVTTPLHSAVESGDVDKVREILEHDKYNVNCTDSMGQTPLHYACAEGNLNVVRVLVSEYKADTSIQDAHGTTVVMAAALGGHEDIVNTLLREYHCPFATADNTGQAVLHYASKGGNASLVQTLVQEHKADVNARDDQNDTPLHLAAVAGKSEVVQSLISEFGCDPNVKGHLGRSLLHNACQGGSVSLVQTLIREYRVDVSASDDQNDTPTHVAAVSGKAEVVQSLLSEFGCDPNMKGHLGRSPLHNACQSGSVSLVQTLIRDHNADVNARDDQNDTPLLLATRNDNTEVVLSLINDFGGDPNIKGYLGKSAMHCACERGNTGLVKSLLPLVLLLEADNQGNTPLHSCSSFGHAECVQSLLTPYAPVLIKNINGQTPLDIAASEARLVLKQYLASNRDILVDYNSLLKFSKKRYSGKNSLTRIFVVGNSGTGKSSLIESLKREGRFESFGRVSESSVPLHTAGIVPSIHTSIYYGRVVFFDFAGDPEYYSSHAAILENLVSSEKGGNIFIIVVDLSEEIREILYYWLSFIQHHNLFRKEPHLAIIGSHSDIARENKRMELQKLCDKIQSDQVVAHKVPHFLLDCRYPGDKQLGNLRKIIASIAKGSPNYGLSQSACILLGLLERDFSNETAFSVAQLQSHIEITHTALPREIQPLHSLLLELHDIGLLFIVNGSEHFHVVFNIFKLTTEVHRLLFSAEAKLRLRESWEGSYSSLNIGIIPRNILEVILPKNIPKECLVQFQYCQLISHKDVGAFPSLTPSDSTDQSFLFFPALCSVDKSEVSWVTPPGLSYIGWLARCTDPCDYFPPRFLHVLLLRLVFRFTHSVPTQNQVSGAFPDHSHFQRRCTMWKTGVHWLMEEGVECMVELMNGNKDIVVTTKSTEYYAQNCTNVFSRVICCVMETREEFCHSIKPQLFLLDCTDEAVDYLSDDHLFAFDKVEEALHSEGNNWIPSVSGKAKMNRSRLLYMRMFTHWRNLFPIDFNSILDSLANIVLNLYDLGLHLGISSRILEAIEADFPTDTSRRRRELVSGWMNSTADPPCWWRLVQALERIDERIVAVTIQREHSKSYL